ncbi:DnaD domain-containing protein [Aneurinibacillus sp. REN35]|uniref:DnaD domain-containing protein n=1 Tax=Aneurinibacillus sp. REN35 TaxID=3237286 RepID=UPI003528CC82
MTKPPIKGGYILLSRKMIESEIWEKPPLFLKVWIYLLSKAQHGNYKNLKRGQLVTSIPEIIEACSWKVGYRTERPTKDQIFKILNWLRSASESNDESNVGQPMITTTKATHGMLVNIENYCFYQTSSNYESNAEDDDEDPAKAPRKQRQADNINKNYKELQELNNTTPTPPTHAHAKENPIAVYEQEIGRFTDTIRDKMIDWLDNGYFDEPEAIMIAAIQEAAVYEKRSWAYLERILQECLNKNIRTVEQFQQKKAEAAAEKEKKLVRLPKEERDEKRQRPSQPSQYEYPY